MNIKNIFTSKKKLIISLFRYFKKFIKKIILKTVFINLIFLNYAVASNNSLMEILSLYNYGTIEKKALEDLMLLAGILPKNTSLSKNYPTRDNINELINDILDFVEQTQTHFVGRNNNKERWEVSGLSWTQGNEAKIIEATKILGFVEEVPPTIKQIDAICILGATMPTMEDRLAYAASLFNNSKLEAKYLILLAGERKVVLDHDGNKDELSQIAKNFNINDFNRLTETHLIKQAYKNSSLYNKLPVVIIDTPSYDLPRPTTATTIVELIKWLEQHKEVKKIIFVSNQAHVKYQEAVIKQILATTDIAFEVIGPAINIKDEENISQTLLDGLGGFIFASTPRIILSLTDKIEDPELIKRFEKIYSKNLLVFNDVNKLLQKK